MDKLLRIVGHVNKETTQLYLHDDEKWNNGKCLLI